MAPAIMCDTAISARSEKEHLVLERICGERPAVAEDYRLPRTPVVVINLRTVLGSDRTHVTTPSRLERKERLAKRKGTFCGGSLNLSPRKRMRGRIVTIYHREKKDARTNCHHPTQLFPDTSRCLNRFRSLQS